MVSVCEHDVQFVDCPKHVWQVELQLRQEPAALLATRYCPTAQVDVHVPATELNVAPSTHDVQPVAVPSEQLAHEAWHPMHVLFASENLLLGQLATHVLSSK